MKCEPDYENRIEKIRREPNCADVDGDWRGWRIYAAAAGYLSHLAESTFSF